jgi:hypothetical protein
MTRRPIIGVGAVLVAVAITLGQFLAACFAGRAQRRAAVGEVAERDGSLLSHRSLCGKNR